MKINWKINNKKLLLFFIKNIYIKKTKIKYCKLQCLDIKLLWNIFKNFGKKIYTIRLNLYSYQIKKFKNEYIIFIILF